MIATTDGLVAYTGVRLGAEQTAEFTPVASYPGLTADVRARLGEMKVAPVSAEMVRDTVMPEASREIPTATVTVPKTVAPKRRSGRKRIRHRTTEPNFENNPMQVGSPPG